MFALWCLVKSPLMLGTDLRELSVDSEAYRSEVTHTTLVTRSVSTPAAGSSPTSA